MLVLKQIGAASRENLSSGVCDQVRFKTACSATEARKSLEILDIASTDIIISKDADQTARMCRLVCVFVVRK